MAQTQNITSRQAGASVEAGSALDTVKMENAKDDGGNSSSSGQESQKIGASTASQEQDETDPDSDIHQSRMNKLQYLLQRSQVYSRIMSDKMKREKEARNQKEKRESAKHLENVNGDQKHPTAAKETRSSQRTAGDDEAGAEARKRPMRSTQKNKRRNDEQKYMVSDYIDKTDVISAKAAPVHAETKEKADLVTTSFKQPSLITGATLRDYQLYGVEWLIGLYENGLNGILADEMGLGKTLQTIAFIAHLKSKNQWGPYLIVCPTSTLQNWVDEINRFAPELNALLYYSSDKKQRRQWIDEYRHEPKTAKDRLHFPLFVTSYELAINDSRMLGSLRWKFIVVDEGHRLKNRNARLTRELKSYYSANRLILTGTPVHNNLAELWSLLNFILPDVFDNLEEFEKWFDFSDLQSEGGSARILSREQSKNVISTLRDILDPFILQREKKHVEKDLPPKKEYMLYAPLTVKQRDLYEEVLNNSIRARLTEMMTGMTWDEIKATGSLKAGEGWDEPLRTSGAKDSSGGSGEVQSNRAHAAAKRGSVWSNGGDKTPMSLASSMPSSGTSTPSKRAAADDVMEADQGKPRKSRRSQAEQRKNYNDDSETEKQFMDRMETSDNSAVTSKRGSRRGTQTPDERVAVLSMADVQRQSKEHAVKQAQKDIANMRLQNPVMQLRKLCGHPFLFYWPRDPQTGQYVANEELINASGKMLMLNRLLDALWARGHKVLLFSQFTTMLDILQEWCEDYKGVTPFRIDGSVDVHERSRLMKEFNTDKSKNACKLFLLSTRAGGLGVNLVAADTVIFYDTDWNPQMDRQAQDRAHRIGQTKPVLVFRLVTRDTAEERIVKRAFAKQQLSTLVMSGDQFSKQTTDAAASFATGRKSRVEEWTALLEELKRESVQFDVADKDSEMISDAHLDLLLDRSPAVYERRQVGWSGDDTAAKAKRKSNGGAASKGKSAFEVTDVLDVMEKQENQDVDFTSGDDEAE